MFFDIPILAITAVANITIALFTYTRNPRSATNRLFAALTFVIAGWSVATYISTTVDSNPTATWLVRFVMFFSVPVGVLFFLLMHTYPRNTLAVSRSKFLIIIGAMILTMIVALTPLLFETTTITPGRAPQPKVGMGIILYVPVVIFGIIYGIIIIIKKYVQSRGLQRVQNSYLLIGVITMFTLIIALNFVAVNVFNTTAFIPYGPLFTLPFVGLTAYSIIRHRLMDIRAAIARSLSLSVLIGTVLLIYGILVIFAVPYITDLTGLRGDVIAAAAALVSIPLARYVQLALTKLTDRFLFQKQVDYREALVEIGKELSATIKISDVTNTVVKAMQDVLRSEKTVIFLKRLQGTDFVPVASSGAGDINVSIPLDHVLIKHLKHASGPLVKDELALQREQEQQAWHVQEIEKVEQTFTWLDISVVAPLYVNNQFTGMIALGDKLAGTPYMQDDLNFLSALAPQAATALENAQLYQESLEFGKKLKLEVDRATYELAAANDQLRDLDKAKSEFLSIASHQLYTPLTPIRGYLSMLLEGEYGPIPGKQRPIVKMLEISATRLITLLKGLLDISRIESGRLELNLESVDIAEMADDLVKNMLPNALKKRLKLNFNKPASEVPHVVADQERIRQVLLNMIDNAIKYTAEGQVDVRLRHVGDEVVFSVTDTGRGIGRENILRLFNKFSRVDTKSRLRAEGTGLGLYVAKQIVKEHHGDVEVDSVGEGKGSTFSVRLPVEGSPRSLKAGTKTSVEIKAGETAQ